MSKHTEDFLIENDEPWTAARYEAAQDRAEVERNAYSQGYEDGHADATAAAEQSRPLTADDEMVLRFMNTYDRLGDGSKDSPSLNHFTAARTSLTRSALTAALTPPPPRPEGAEDLKHPVIVALAGMNTTRVHGLTQEDIEGLCDRLAERGVRVTGAGS